MHRAHAQERESLRARDSWTQRLLVALLVVGCALISNTEARSSEDRRMAQNAAIMVGGLIDPTLKEQGFVRSGLSWYRYEKESILVINVQPATYAPWVYINLGVYYRRYGSENEPDIVSCQLDARLNGILPQKEAMRQIYLLDLSNDIPIEERRHELQTMIRNYGVPFLDKLASFEAARAALIQNPKLAHVAPAARADLMSLSGSAAAK